MNHKYRGLTIETGAEIKGSLILSSDSERVYIGHAEHLGSKMASVCISFDEVRPESVEIIGDIHSEAKP